MGRRPRVECIELVWCPCRSSPRRHEWRLSVARRVSTLISALEMKLIKSMRALPDIKWWWRNVWTSGQMIRRCGVRGRSLIAAIRAASCRQKTVLCWWCFFERVRRSTHFRRCNLPALLHQLILSPQIPNDILRRMLPGAFVALMASRLVHCMKFADTESLPRNVNHLGRSARFLILIPAFSRCRESKLEGAR